MSDKVRSALEIAEENAIRREKTLAEEYLEKADQYESTRKEDGSVGIPQEKLETHVINQDEATGFDIDKQSDRFKSDKQSFSRIRRVYAEGPSVVIEVDEGKIDTTTQAAVLGNKRITPSEALQRATALNSMLAHNAVVLADRRQVEDIIEETIVAVLEAQENIMTANGATKEDIKRTRKARLDRIDQFEAAVKKVRGEKELQELQQMLLFKKVLKNLAH